MASKHLRAAVVGASSLLGKELANELAVAQDRVWDVTLIDVATDEAVQAGGTVTSAGDEALLIQNLTPGSFSGMDVVFFAGDASVAERHAREAVDAGAIVVDLTGALEAKGVPVSAPLIAKSTKASGKIVASAHPAALLLGSLAKTLQDGTFVATVMEPASEAGDAGVDEVHRQTVALLSFQPVPQDIFGQQVAFSLSASSPEEAKVKLQGTAATVKAQLAQLLPAARVSAQFVQAPVFHGYSASIFVQTENPMSVAEISDALKAGPFEIVSGDEADSTIAAIEKGTILVRISESELQGFWLWAVSDNLKLAAQNAIACAGELVG